MSVWNIVAQSVTGTVTGPDKAPIPGVTVTLKGTSEGTATDDNGVFNFKFVKGGILMVSSIGYTPVEVTMVDGQLKYDVQLAEQSTTLSDVVVVAQGLVRDKRALGYSQTTVDEKALRDRPQADAMRSLQGKVAGVNITSTSGVSGTGTNVTIRGYSSITGSVQPLFVVDGIPFNSSTNTRGGFTSGGQSSSSRFLDLDPNNIENISILKGLAATVTYGDQGRNGVILVTTKNGSKKRRAEFTVTQSYFTSEAHLPRYQNDYVGGFQQNLGYFFSNWGPTLKEAKAYPSQNTNTALTTHPYASLSNPALRAGQAAYVASVSPYTMQVFPDNVNDFFQPGSLSTTSVNVSGGSDKVGYTASASYTDEKGYIAENGLKRLNAGLGLNAILTDKLVLRTSFNFVNTDQVIMRMISHRYWQMSCTRRVKWI
jgi:TonB-dependent SusC/RagA subfamily outer membrane receptor